MQQRAGDRTGQRYPLGTLGDLYRDTERFKEAIAVYERSLAAHRAAGDRRGTGRVLHSLGLTLASIGRADAARDRLRHAFAILDRLGDPEAAAVPRLDWLLKVSFSRSDVLMVSFSRFGSRSVSVQEAAHAEAALLARCW